MTDALDIIIVSHKESVGWTRTGIS